ncbi:uncharacterized protein LOC125845987 [Solanum stenotomum]|uniref:uncharacterized protein LOC125845987 n=1 Tax=Solanum stenotomum TaxID=172797 RepID=UPI0020D055EC|nr:uncharacterized protein LOC125845987 [Solanum stenotomum]
MNHMCFADDMLLFCKGEFVSIKLMLEGLLTFSEASGLITNAGKSNIFSANIERRCLEDICEITGYAKGSLPLKYLGVPISSKKLTIVDCEMLVDKLVCRIRTWGTRNLSYAGRTQLVNSVLLHIHTYWSFIFQLPKKVLKSITAVCRNFLWSGQENTTKSQLISWEKVCRSKKEEGLGIVDCMIWNEAAIAKYVWNIAKKADNLWVKWVNQIYLKEEIGGNINQLLTVVGTGGKYASLKRSLRLDIWVPNKGVYTIQSGYQWRRGNDSQWPWWRDVWNKMNIPKHSFICWIVMHRRILTKDRIGVLEWLKIGINNTSIDGLWRRVTRRAKGKISRSLIKAIIAALIYHIWQARNGALWNKAVTRLTKILKMIKEESRSRTRGSTQKKHTNKDATWIDNFFK